MPAPQGRPVTSLAIADELPRLGDAALAEADRAEGAGHGGERVARSGKDFGWQHLDGRAAVTTKVSPHHDGDGGDGAFRIERRPDSAHSQSVSDQPHGFSRGVTGPRAGRTMTGSHCGRGGRSLAPRRKSYGAADGVCTESALHRAAGPIDRDPAVVGNLSPHEPNLA